MSQCDVRQPTCSSGSLESVLEELLIQPARQSQSYRVFNFGQLEPVTERNLRPTRAGLCAPASAAVVMVGLGWAPGHCVSLCWWGCCWCTLGSLCRTENSTQSTLTLAQAGLGRRTRHGTAEQSPTGHCQLRSEAATTLLLDEKRSKWIAIGI